MLTQEGQCPLPEKPNWHPDTLLADAKGVLSSWRTCFPFCVKLKVQADNYCSHCLREVVPWRLPEVATPSATVAPALGVTPAVADGVARRRWQR